MKTVPQKWLALCCAVVLLLSVFAIPAAAISTASDIPVLRDVIWTSIDSLVNEEQTAKYFILHTKAGGHKEDLYISFPEEGGFRLQSKHEAQTALQGGAEGLFEPRSVRTIDYSTEAATGATVMRGTDGTVLRFQKSGSGFTLQISNAAREQLVAITNRQISFAYDRLGKVKGTLVEMPLAEREAIYAGGERFNSANQVGFAFSLTNLDKWSDDQYSYINVPLFHSNRCYSVWFNMTYTAWADVGKTDPHKYSVRFDGERLDMHLWAGTPLENLQKYTKLTGTSGVPEQWTLGFWTGAMSSAFEGTKLRNAYANLRSLFEGYRENYNFYPEACHGEGTNSTTVLPLSYAQQCGVRMMMWYQPQGTRSSMNTYLANLPSVYPVKNAAGKFECYGYPVMYNAGMLERYGVYDFMTAYSWINEWYDLTNPSTAEVMKARIEQYWDAGLSGAMIDYGENMPFEAVTYSGMSGVEAHNFASYTYAKIANETWTKRFGNNDFVLYERSGCAGSQRFVTNFLGDQRSTWNGYQKQLWAMVSMGASGYNLYGGDLGGLGGKPDNELWNRWVVLSAFSPLMRQQGSVIHMPWDYGITATASFGGYYYLRKNLGPTLMSAAIDANQTGNPLVKGMMMAYPYQLALGSVDNQYLFCDDFLVCAVTLPEQHTLRVQLPRGNTWYSLFTYDAFKGGRTVTAEAPTTFMPVFVKDGAVKAIDLPESMQLSAEMHDDDAEGVEYLKKPSLLITPPDTTRTSVIYVKDGVSSDFRTYDYHTETYENARVDDAVFTVTNTAGSDRQTVLALGVTAAEIQYDGKTLPRLDHMPDSWQEEYGYYVELSGLTTMYLPGGWKELRVVKGDAGYESYALQPVTSQNMANMFDDDPATVYQLPAVDSADFALTAEQPQPVGRIVLKWATGFDREYDIEYSEDGKEWTLLLPDEENDGHTVSQGIGGIETLSFDPVEAKYFRISTVSRGDTAPAPALYALGVYAPDDYRMVTPLPPVADDDDDDDEDDDDSYYGEDGSWGDDDWNWEEEDPDPEDTDPGGDEPDEQTGGRRKKVIAKLVKGFPWWGILLIVAGAVIVATGILLLFLLLRRKKKKEAQAALSAADGSPGDPPLPPDTV